MKTTTNQKTKQAICSVLPWRIDRFDRSKVTIRVVPYQVSQHYQCNPGTMCIYSGNLKSLAQVEIAGEIFEGEDAIEINSRDFLASMQRLITLKYQEFSLKENQSLNSSLASTFTSFKNSEDFKNFDNFNSLILADFLSSNDKAEEEEAPVPPAAISSDIIKGLINAYGDKSALVREAVIHALGLIGPPEASDALETLTRALYDPDGQVRAIGAWAIGKLGDIAANKASKRLIELLKDKFWKVRTSACIALGYMGENVEPSPYPILVKALKDGSINKVVVCETLVRLGVQGEQILLDMLKGMPNTNYGMKTAIIQSFELADVDRPTIDFVIEELFRNAAYK